jgi:hypothetical protein
MVHDRSPSFQRDVVRAREEVQREIGRLAARREELKQCPPRWRDEYVRVDAWIQALTWAMQGFPRPEVAPGVELAKGEN